MSEKPLGNTERTQPGRMRDRAVTDRAGMYEVLDSNILCHLGLIFDGQPFVLPYGYARDGDRILLHGSSGARFMRALADGAPVCVTVTELTGMVVARSTFNSSMNYRSVVVLGRATEVTGDEKARLLEVISDGFLPGRSAEVRASTKKEIAATTLLSIPLEEASLKVRAHGVEDEESDLNTGVWAGVVPLKLVAGEPEPDGEEAASLPVPESVKRYVANPKG
jgi:nitroimidazol reductase NimA-like FMN-containing flavoprotein (pyridoxamine 5'-phosphate oxidase superfamily)